MATIRWKQLYREFEDGGNFTGSFIVSGSMKATGSVSLTGSGAGNLLDTLDVNGRATLRTAAVENLTQGRIVLVGSGSQLIDSPYFTVSGSNLFVTNSFTVNGETGLVYTKGDIILGGGDIYSNQITASIFPTTVTILDLARAAQLINIGASGSLIRVGGDVQIDGDRIQSSTGQTILSFSEQDVDFKNNVSIQNDLIVSGNFTVIGGTTEIIISSSKVEIGDNIIKLNAYAPYKRYAGIEVIDSGSNNNSASILWDSINDNWLIQSSSQESAKIISTNFGMLGYEPTLTNNYIPKSTGNTTIGNSLLQDNGSQLSYNTNAFVVSSSGDISISGSVGITGVQSNSFIVTNNLGKISSVTSSITGDIVQWNGSSFVSSNVIDGGTF